MQCMPMLAHVTVIVCVSEQILLVCVCELSLFFTCVHGVCIFIFEATEITEGTV